MELLEPEPGDVWERLSSLEYDFQEINDITGLRAGGAVDPNGFAVTDIDQEERSGNLSRVYASLHLADANLQT